MTNIALKILLAALLVGCFGTDRDEAGDRGFALRFKLDEVYQELPLDSLHITIAIDDTGSPQAFKVDLRSGRSTAQLEGREGQAYVLDFELYSAGYLIGGGKVDGVLVRGDTILLKPMWDEDNARRAKKDLGLGAILPPNLAEDFTLAQSGVPMVLPLDSLKSLVYRWSVLSGDSTVLSGEGPQVSVDLPADLAGKQVLIRVQAWDGTRVKEERSWIFTVLASLPAIRPRFARIRNAPDAGHGSTLSYAYDGDGRLIRIETFASLAPAKDAAPVAVESLAYEGGQIARAILRLADGGLVDSLFSYDGQGRLRAMTVSDGAAKVADSLFYREQDLVLSRRYASGVLQEEARYRVAGPGLRQDSVFTQEAGSLKFTRLVENRYHGDSLVERRFFVKRAGLEPQKRELIAYNGIGLRARVSYYAEGASPILERSDAYGYDSLGLLSSWIRRDEASGEPEILVAYEYSDAGAQENLSVGPSAKTATRIPPPSPSLTAILAQLGSAHGEAIPRRETTFHR